MFLECLQEIIFMKYIEPHFLMILVNYPKPEYLLTGFQNFKIQK